MLGRTHHPKPFCSMAHGAAAGWLDLSGLHSEHSQSCPLLMHCPFPAQAAVQDLSGGPPRPAGRRNQVLAPVTHELTHELPSPAQPAAQSVPGDTTRPANRAHPVLAPLTLHALPIPAQSAFQGPSGVTPRPTGRRQQVLRIASPQALPSPAQSASVRGRIPWLGNRRQHGVGQRLAAINLRLRACSRPLSPCLPSGAEPRKDCSWLSPRRWQQRRG